MTLAIPQTLQELRLDDDGFMLDPEEWTPEIAEALAEREGIELSGPHWTVIEFSRAEFKREGEAPTLRRIIKASGVTTKEMYALFPGGPAKMASKIAGLGKPTGCI